MQNHTWYSQNQKKLTLKTKQKKTCIKKKLALKKSLPKFIDKKYHQKTINAHEKIRIVSCMKMIV